MNPDAVFNRYDIRGTYPDEIDEAFAERLGKTVGTYAQQEHRMTVVVGRDTRDASASVTEPFIRGVQQTGANVVDVGVSTTDRTALATAHHTAIGAMITASHHAWGRTGFKLLYSKGHGFGNDDLDRVEELFRTQAFETGDGSRMNTQHEFDETYLERIHDSFGAYADDIDATVLIDTVGAAERTAQPVFEELGADTVEVTRDDMPDPEPQESTRKDVVAQLEETGADIAVGYDPDADRVYCIHPDLGWIGGDHLFYLLARIVSPETIVASVDTAPFIEDAGASVVYTRVGDVFVSAEGVEQDADLLGEPNGHFAVTDFCWYNSGIFASLLLAAHHDELADMLAPVKHYRTVRHVEPFEDAAARDDAMQTIKKTVAKRYELIDRVDGLKFRTDDLTCLVRPSGTSPKIRLIVHGEGDITKQEERVRDQLFAGDS